MKIPTRITTGGDRNKYDGHRIIQVQRNQKHSELYQFCEFCACQLYGDHAGEDAEADVAEDVEPGKDPLPTSPFMGRSINANGISPYQCIRMTFVDGITDHFVAIFCQRFCYCNRVMSAVLKDISADIHRIVTLAIQVGRVPLQVRLLLDQRDRTCC